MSTEFKVQQIKTPGKTGTINLLNSATVTVDTSEFVCSFTSYGTPNNGLFTFSKDIVTVSEAGIYNISYHINRSI